MAGCVWSSAVFFGVANSVHALLPPPAGPLQRSPTTSTPGRLAPRFVWNSFGARGAQHAASVFFYLIIVGRSNTTLLLLSTTPPTSSAAGPAVRSGHAA